MVRVNKYLREDRLRSKSAGQLTVTDRSETRVPSVICYVPAGDRLDNQNDYQTHWSGGFITCNSVNIEIKLSFSL